MADHRFFSTTKKGEILEFKQDLTSLDRGKRKDAVKKVIAAMTVGKDVSSLFPDVVNCMQTDDMELKKLVYLYLINYAKTQPDLAIMAVNTFVKDSQDPNPLIRALAVRTMGCIRVDKITEYLCDPLQRCLKDDDPYVRKTAAVCVAKLYDISPELVEDRGFLDALRDMIGDANPMVVANAVAALSEMQAISAKPVFQIDSASLFKLLRALNECTEWGQVFILDSLAHFTPPDAKDAESIIERVSPRLQHANSAVVLSAVKVILNNMQAINDTPLLAALSKKLAPPLVTLLGAEPEIQYVALRNINLIVQRYPAILAHEVKVFFCKYNDPIYVKMEKLEIMIKLANERNIDQVLLEFKEYATEVDVDFVRKAVRAIGRCAVSIERAAERCINVLLELIQTKVNYVVQEAIIVIKDIFRRYPNRYETIISTLCDNLESLDEPEAKASMIWIIGEYAERIDNADELLEQFLESFPEETVQVQLQLVTATVKLFLKKPTEKPQQLIQLVLTYATQETDNPDLRDRAYIYWRLLSTDPEAAKDVVLAEKPVISDTQDSLDAPLLDGLLHELGTLASVYHKPAASFVSQARLAVQRAEDLAAAGGLREEGSTSSQTEAPASTKATTAAAIPDLLGDLMDLGPPEAMPAAPEGAIAALSSADLLGGLADPTLAAQPTPQGLPVLATNEGLIISGMIIRHEAQPMYKLALRNTSSMSLDGFMIQFNKNVLGLAPASQAVPASAVPAGGVTETLVPLVQRADLQASNPAGQAVLQVAIKSNQLGVLYFKDSLSLAPVLAENLKMEPSTFVDRWRSIADSEEQQAELAVSISSVDAAKAALQRAGFLVLAHKSVGGEDILYVAGQASLPAGPMQALMELRFSLGSPGVRGYYRGIGPHLTPLLSAALSASLD